MALSTQEKRLVRELVGYFEEYRLEIKRFVNQLHLHITETKELFKQIHSIRWRIKESSHLEDSLIRKINKSHEKGEEFDITKENLFSQVNDLAGLRLLHLYTRQFDAINQALTASLQEGQFPVIEGPIAKTWDDESRSYFAGIGVTTEESESLYTSVHYVIESNYRTKYTCELQVRTLAEEIWGEVSHSFHYPHPTKSIACGEQIKVLARLTSGCSRLVDSVFRSYEEYQVMSVRNRKDKAPCEKKKKISKRKTGR